MLTTGPVTWRRTHKELQGAHCIPLYTLPTLFPLILFLAVPVFIFFTFPFFVLSFPHTNQSAFYLPPHFQLCVLFNSFISFFSLQWGPKAPYIVPLSLGLPVLHWRQGIPNVAMRRIRDTDEVGTLRACTGCPTFYLSASFVQLPLSKPLAAPISSTFSSSFSYTFPAPLILSYYLTHLYPAFVTSGDPK